MSLESHWQHLGVPAVLLYPLSLLFRLISALRRLMYRVGIFQTHHFAVPVIVVGNITVGGSGKTPLVIWLTEFLREHGLKPGLVARGYKGQANSWPQQVRPDSDPASVGDEAVLLAQRSGCPVCVGPDRPEAVRALLAHTECNIVISDDGMQHYAMGRDLEIAVIDGQRRFGNGQLLPSGPLREPQSRLRTVDLVVVNGEPRPREFAMRLGSPRVYPLHGGDAVDISRFDGQRVRAIAGIGNPQRFFDMLSKHGLLVEAHPFPDHHSYSRADLTFAEERPLLMTEKDAVKCRRIMNGDAWVVSVQVLPEELFVHRLNMALEQIQSGRSE